MSELIRCTNCAISEKFPGVEIAESGVCNLCESFDGGDYENRIVKTNHDRIIEAIEERRGKSLYDVLVAYSGGKDSSFTLHYLKAELGLNVLALMIDNDFISEQAFINARKMCGALKVDLMIFKPEQDFMHNMYNKSLAGNMYNVNQLTRANAACLSCINLINNFALNEAIIRNIPIIAGGYIGGQIPDESGVVKLDRAMFKDFRKRNSEMLSREIDARMANYLKLSDPVEGQIYPILLNPLLGLEYNEDEIVEVISQYGWSKPADTGKSSSNCLMNDYAIAVHYERYKYHSYEAEICLQVRRGSMSRKEAMNRLNDIKPSKSFEKILARMK